MDGSKFDDFARAFGRGISRRKMLRDLAGGATGIIVSGAIARPAAAAAGREVTICHATDDSNAPYQSLTIGQAELNRYERQGDFLRVDCCADNECPNQYGECGSGSCQNGYCVQLPIVAGTPCDDDGQVCTINNSCDGAFNCAGGDPVLCAETENTCTTAVCSEAAQGCVEVLLDDGTQCAAGDACTAHVCASGSCTATPKTDCTGNCADCAGECLDLSSDEENCGACVLVCGGGDQCHQPICNGGACGEQATEHALCTTEGGPGRCDASGVCQPKTPICTDASTCSTEGDCGPGEACVNGGCFLRYTQSGCPTDCANCRGGQPVGETYYFYCEDVGSYVGNCHSTAECPSGSFCDTQIFADSAHTTHLCVQPCATLQVPF